MEPPKEEGFYCDDCRKTHLESDKIEIIYGQHGISVRCMKHKMWTCRDVIKRIIKGQLAMNPSAPICSECAESNGWQWPEGHLGTMSLQECVQCEEEKPCCQVGDWRRKK